MFPPLTINLKLYFNINAKNYFQIYNCKLTPATIKVSSIDEVSINALPGIFTDAMFIIEIVTAKALYKYEKKII